MVQILDAYNSLLDKYTKDDIMILSPFNKGPVGTVAINKAIQSRYNPNPDTNAIRKISGGEEIMFKVGDKVIYSKYAGNEVKLDGSEFVVIRQSDVLAVVE